MPDKNTRIQVGDLAQPSRYAVSTAMPEAFIRPRQVNAGLDLQRLAESLSTLRPGMQNLSDQLARETSQKQEAEGMRMRQLGASDKPADMPFAQARGWDRMDARMSASDYSVEAFNAVRNSPLWNDENAKPDAINEVLKPIRDKYLARGANAGAEWAGIFGPQSQADEDHLTQLLRHNHEAVRQHNGEDAVVMATHNTLMAMTSNPQITNEQAHQMLETQVWKVAQDAGFTRSEYNLYMTHGWRAFFTDLRANEQLAPQIDRFVNIFQTQPAGTGLLAGTAAGAVALGHGIAESNEWKNQSVILQERAEKKQRQDDSLLVIERTSKMTREELTTQTEPPRWYAENIIKNGGSIQMAQMMWTGARDMALQPARSDAKKDYYKTISEMAANPSTVDLDKVMRQVEASQQLGLISQEQAVATIRTAQSIIKNADMYPDPQYQAGVHARQQDNASAAAAAIADAIKVNHDDVLSIPVLGDKVNGDRHGVMESIFREQLTNVDLTPARHQADEAAAQSQVAYMAKHGNWASLSEQQKREMMDGAALVSNQTFKTATTNLLNSVQERIRGDAKKYAEVEAKAKQSQEMAKLTLDSSGEYSLATIDKFNNPGNGLWFSGSVYDLKDELHAGLRKLFPVEKGALIEDGPSIAKDAEDASTLALKSNTTLHTTGSGGKDPTDPMVRVYYSMDRTLLKEKEAELVKWMSQNKTAMNNVLERGDIGFWSGLVSPVDSSTGRQFGQVMSAIKHIRIATYMSTDEAKKVPLKQLDPLTMCLMSPQEYHDRGPAAVNDVLEMFHITDPQAAKQVIDAQTWLVTRHAKFAEKSPIQKFEEGTLIPKGTP